jgi:hypothetical protein
MRTADADTPLDLADVLVTEVEQTLKPVETDDFFVRDDVVGDACLRGFVAQLLCTSSIEVRRAMLTKQGKDFVGIDVGERSPLVEAPGRQAAFPCLDEGYRVDFVF